MSHYKSMTRITFTSPKLCWSVSLPHVCLIQQFKKHSPRLPLLASFSGMLSKIIRCGETLGRILLAVLGSTEVIQRRQKAKAKSGREPDALWGTSADLLPPPGLWPGGPPRPAPPPSRALCPRSRAPAGRADGARSAPRQTRARWLKCCFILTNTIGAGNRYKKAAARRVPPSVRASVRPSGAEAGRRVGTVSPARRRRPIT